MTNIISNAVKFTERGRIVLKVFVKRKRLYFSVSDTGIGISRAEIGDIFDEFTQANDSIAQKYPGSGLGLTICRKLVELLQGEIKADSRPGKGTTITFSIPMDSEQDLCGNEVSGADDGTDGGTKENDSPGSKESEAGVLTRLLVAEDDKFSRRAIEMMLDHRYELIFARDGKEVVEKYFSTSPDVVLMDIMMPVMDGYQAFDEIVRLRSHHTVPIIALTAKAMIDDRDKLLAYGVTDYISKPISDEILIKTIDKYIANISHTRSPEQQRRLRQFFPQTPL